MGRPKGSKNKPKTSEVAVLGKSQGRPRKYNYELKGFYCEKCKRKVEVHIDAGQKAEDLHDCR